MGLSGFSGDVSAHVNGVEKLLLRFVHLVGTDVEVRRCKGTVKWCGENAFLSWYLKATLK